MVSVARRSDPDTLSEIESGLNRFVHEHGWYNAPKQLCRGGDIRSLAFCCMPVKPCPLLPALKRYNLSPQEYVKLKTDAVSGTILEGGSGTCFGSLVYCCKDTTPCMFRDSTLGQAGIRKPQYMDEKRSIARKIMERLFS
jgi:putative methanogenesis marker domain 9